MEAPCPDDEEMPMYDVQHLCSLTMAEQTDQMSSWITALLALPEQERQQAIRRLTAAIDALGDEERRTLHQVEVRILLDLGKEAIKTYVRSRRWGLQAAASELQAIFMEQVRQSPPEVQQRSLAALRELVPSSSAERGGAGRSLRPRVRRP
jgi:hypothetical protein